MFPYFSAENIANEGARHSELPGEIRFRSVGRQIHSPYFPYKTICKFCFVMLLSLQLFYGTEHLSPPSFLNTILNIVPSRSSKEMVRVHTIFNVAMMAHLKSFWYFGHLAFVHQPVDGSNYSSLSNSTISIAPLCSIPQPTGCWTGDINSFPEPFPEGLTKPLYSNTSGFVAYFFSSHYGIMRNRA